MPRAQAPQDAADEPLATVRLAPRIRIERADGGPLPTQQSQSIEPFLAESLVVDDDSFQRAPRIVALTDPSRMMAAQGDRVYVRGPADAPVLQGPGLPQAFRVFRATMPLKDPASGEILGYEGRYVGQVWLVRGEGEVDGRIGARRDPVAMPSAGDHDVERGAPREAVSRRVSVPAAADITRSQQEIRIGDRLLPELPRELRSQLPRAPDVALDAQVVRVDGAARRYAGQHQIVVINKGWRDGVEAGHVLSLLSAGAPLIDQTEQARTRIQLPDERNGVAMVWRAFDRVSYALVLEVRHPVQVGDKLLGLR